MTATTERPTIVLVTGSGRSGTSSLAGSLHRLGLLVPHRMVEADEQNPRGYYESSWVIKFHKSRLRELSLHNIDARPWAVDLVAASLEDGSAVAELTAWLQEHVAGQGTQFVIKDPHALWFVDVWRAAAEAIGADLRMLTSVRHPAEVVGSRDIAYLQKQSAAVRRTKETSNIAGWVHAALLTEKAGRDMPRAFILYADMMTDWRTALLRTGEQLDLDFEPKPEAGAHHPIDDFLDAGLQRSRLTWDDVSVPQQLRDMAEEVWQLLGRLVQAPGDEATIARLDEIHEAYDDLFSGAVAIAFDHTRAEVQSAQGASTEKVEQLQQRVRRLRKRLDAANAKLERQAQPPAPQPVAARVAQKFRRG